MFQLPGVSRGHSYKECTSPHLQKGAANWGSCCGRRSGQRKNRNGHNSGHSGASNSRHYVTLQIFFRFKLLLPSVPFCHLEFMLQLK